MFFLYDFGWSTLVFVSGAFCSFWKFNRLLCGPFCHCLCCFRFVYLCFFFFKFSLVCQADVRLVELERKVRALEQEKTLETTEGTLVNLRRYLNRPNSAFDRFEVLDILQALVRLARTQAHQKAEEYAATLTRYERDGTLSVPPSCSVCCSGCWETPLELRSLKKPLPY